MLRQNALPERSISICHRLVGHSFDVLESASLHLPDFRMRESR